MILSRFKNRIISLNRTAIYNKITNHNKLVIPNLPALKMFPPFRTWFGICFFSGFRNLYLITLFLVLFSACKKQEIFPGYREINGNYYALVGVGDKMVKPHINDLIVADLKYMTLHDSVFFSGVRKFKLTIPDYPGSIDEMFIRFSQGDSALMIVDTKRFFEKDLQIDVPEFLKSQRFFKIQCRIVKVESRKQYLEEKTRFLSWLVGQKQFEKANLEIFLNMLTKYEKKKDLYKVDLINGEGDFVKVGDTLVVNYEGHFLDGKMFDSTWKRNQPFEFVYGTEMQVIQGLEIALRTMKEKERALFVMPSEMAFGEKGSSTRIVPPYTPVVFEVEIEKIN